MKAGARVHDARYESADAGAIRALQVRRLRELLRFVYATNEFYRAHWDAAGVDVERVDSLEALAAIVPMVSKSDLTSRRLSPDTIPLT